MTKELQKILDEHKLWLSDNTKGQRADLSEANLRNADLSKADLSGADLSGADLRNADLREANLRNADLREANLRNADLSEANLRNADLSEANLRNADLRNTNLSEANLEGAYLGNTCVFTFTLGAHFGFAHFGEQYADGSYVRIGCEGHSLKGWLENYKWIGEQNAYTAKQIKDYGDFLKYLAKRKA